MLREDIGLPWPIEDPLVIHETAGRDPDASAGVYDPALKRMDVAYWADRGVVIHQAAHGWFNGDLLADRWANEGFATFYALRTAAKLGVPAASPEVTDEARAASFPLNAWAASDGQGPTTTAADTYGYAASLALANALARPGRHGRPGHGLVRCGRGNGGVPAAGTGHRCWRWNGHGCDDLGGRRRRP